MAVNHAEDRTLEKLVRSYGRLVRSVVFRIAGDRAGLVAEDVEQRVMVALWKVMKGEQEIGDRNFQSPGLTVAPEGGARKGSWLPAKA